MPGPTVYFRLAERIRSDVMTYRDGVAIPSVRSLARRYDAAPNTVRKALGVLVDQGDIASGGANLPYVRRRPATGPSYCKPHPQVALMSHVAIQLGGDGYVPLLLGRFVSDLHKRGLMAGIVPRMRDTSFVSLPGGVAIGPERLRFSGIAFASGGPSLLMADMVAAGAVVMSLDYLSDVEGVDSVAVDCESEAVMAVEHFSGLGHRTIGFLDVRLPDAPSFWPGGKDPDGQRFSAALLAAKHRIDLDASPRYHLTCSADKTRSDASVRAAVDQLWRLSPAPTALICFDPTTAVQARATLAGRGIGCPDRVSILTRGSKRDAGLGFAILASDPERMGAAAAEHILNRFTNPHMSPARLLFPSILIPSDSTGPRR